MKGLTRLQPSFRALNKHYVHLDRLPFVRYQSITSINSSQSWSTPLAERLAKAITTTGPISLASYMRQCLTSEDGYYTRKNKSGVDPFGVSGDFITSPEISQVFGELVGIWTVSEWLSQGSPSKGVNLIELGPGRGTLMTDFLRAGERFQKFFDSIDTIYLVEASSSLREAQRKLLCGETPFKETEQGVESRSIHSKSLRIVWLDNLNLLPVMDKSITPFFIAHEFFDALPIHAFESIPPSTLMTQNISNLSYTSDPKTLHQQTRPATRSSRNEWRELLVSNKSKCQDLASQKLSNDLEFQLTRSPVQTPHSILLPSLSPRYQNLLSMANSVIEISPESLSITAEIAKYIGSRPSGAALIIDYGTLSTVPANTLRGIRSHAIVSPFSRPGDTDLSASVDFVGLAHAALEASENVECWGPAPQWFWLNEMGVEERGEALERGAKDAEAQKRIRDGWRRLVDKGPRGMGNLYNVMSIVPRGRGDNGGVSGFGRPSTTVSS